MRQLTAPELADWLRDPARPVPQVLDVREGWEVAVCALPDSVHIPMGQVPARGDELDPDRPVVCVCHHGMRSLQVAAFLARHPGGGFAIDPLRRQTSAEPPSAAAISAHSAPVDVSIQIGDVRRVRAGAICSERPRAASSADRRWSIVASR